MRKIQLDLTNLRVESFATDGTAKARGTVAGHEWTITGICCQHTDACTGTDSCSGEVACICESLKAC
jgi:hypothetical protein